MDPTAVSTAPDADVPIPVNASGSYLFIKHALDRIIAFLAIIALSPLLLFVAWRVRSDSPGPALFCQERAGRLGRPFPFYKFRSMRTDVNPYGDSPESGDDPRITKLGKWLRETSVDELPQLFNVVRGEMSLVGPRPQFVGQIGDWNARQKSRLLVKPGLTGLSQIYGRASMTIERKLEWDVEYVRSIGPMTDLRTLWKTIGVVLNKDGMYQKEYSETRRRFEQDANDGDATNPPRDDDASHDPQSSP